MTESVVIDEQDAEGIRVRIYRRFVEEGRLGSRDQVTRALGVSEPALGEALAQLAAARHLALDARGEIVLAHPFATRDFGFSVKSDRQLWWGGCAWDSFAIPNLVPGASPALVATTCPACGAAHAWMVDASGPPAGEQVAHFLVPMRHVWDDVVHTCENQRIFCNESCVDAWLAQTGHPKGFVFGLDRLWRLASHWYDGRLDAGYRRREPREAAQYFADAGLVGSFWGNTG